MPDLYRLLYVTCPIISGNNLTEQLEDISTDQEVTCIGGEDTLPKQVI